MPTLQKSPRWGVRAGRALLTLCLLALGACADPEARFNEFVKREEKARMELGAPGGTGVIDAGEFVLATPEQSAGTFLFVISTPLGRTKPVVNLLEVEAEMMGENLLLKLRDRPLSAADRKTPVGDFGAVNELLVRPDGTYEGRTIHAVIPGAANPIDGNMVEADILLMPLPTPSPQPGETVDFLCGNVSGTLFAYGLPLSIAGSTFTATRIKDPDNYPPAVIDCALNPAEPLK